MELNNAMGGSRKGKLVPSPGVTRVRGSITDVHVTYNSSRLEQHLQEVKQHSDEVNEMAVLERCLSVNTTALLNSR